MFFRNKKKIDSRVRFQNQSFKNRLNQARGYKRPQRSLPKTDWEIFLAKIGLGSWLARFLSILVLVFLVYIVYIPNFFFVKQINITGTDGTSSQNIEASVNSFLNKKLPWPEKNLILLSKTTLKAYLLKNNRQVLKVNSINKKLPSTLNLDITQRVDEFAIQTSVTAYSISNDGLVTGELTPNASGTLPETLGLIKLSEPESLAWGQQALSRDKASFLNTLKNRLPAIGKSPLDYFQIDSLQTPDLTVYFKNGFKVLFDFNSDVDKTLTQLKLLLSQFSDVDLKRLFYVDMRFEDNGYLCYKGTACVKDINLSNINTSTTTPAGN